MLRKILAFIMLIGLVITIEVSAAQTPQTDQEAPLITIKELKAKLDKHEEMLIIDVSEHTGLVIRGALNIPLSKLTEELSKLPKDRLIITVCGCHNEATSSFAARMLKEKGFTKLAVLKGGQQAWDEARYPVDMITDDGRRFPDDRGNK